MDTSIVLAIVGTVGAAAGAVASWCFSTVRRAAELTGTDARLRKAIKDQAACIRILEDQVRLLNLALGDAGRRIEQLEQKLKNGAEAIA